MGALLRRSSPRRERYADWRETPVMVDIADLGLELRIWLAQQGDGEELAELMPNYVSHPKLCKFLAGVVAGHIKLKPKLPKTRTYHYLVIERELRERAVEEMIEHGMERAGKRRDKNLRTHLTRTWCERYGL